MHHIRPKLLSPDDFPGKELAKSMNEVSNRTKWIEVEGVIPMRAMVVRYTAVAMLQTMTTR